MHPCDKIPYFLGGLHGLDCIRQKKVLICSENVSLKALFRYCHVRDIFGGKSDFDRTPFLLRFESRGPTSVSYSSVIWLSGKNSFAILPDNFKISFCSIFYVRFFATRPCEVILSYLLYNPFEIGYPSATELTAINIS